ncbi:MAG: hypothetical protein OXG18_10265 [Gemmatimonadetes bacterium]|nr:hypothetical protein [Gemmatimonadota bacterium]
MIVAVGVQPTDRGSPDEHVRLAEVATAGETFRALTATARHYAKVRDQHHRATARSSNGRVLASVGVNPRAAAGSTIAAARQAPHPESAAGTHRRAT